MGENICNRHTPNMQRTLKNQGKKDNSPKKYKTALKYMKKS